MKPAQGIKNVFINDWKKHFFSDGKKRVASIPFIRNIIEYTKGEDDPDFLKLTSLLHWKKDSSSITEADLDAIFNKTFSGSVGAVADGANSVISAIELQAKECLGAAESVNFENKIVLSIAIRLNAEKFMVAKINDQVFTDSITSNQTPKLLERFKSQFGSETHAISVVQRVILMTPENIHVNSFMYEPILDMSDEHLRKLYQDVAQLK